MANKTSHVFIRIIFFLQYGFEVIPTPESVHKKLSDAVEKAVENWDNIRSEGYYFLLFFYQNLLFSFSNREYFSYLSNAPI